MWVEQSPYQGLSAVRIWPLLASLISFLPMLSPPICFNPTAFSLFWTISSLVPPQGLCISCSPGIQVDLCGSFPRPLLVCSNATSSKKPALISHSKVALPSSLSYTPSFHLLLSSWRSLLLKITERVFILIIVCLLHWTINTVGRALSSASRIVPQWVLTQYGAYECVGISCT